ncbi:MAG: hypothetical protein WCP60_01950 [bacterium]
MAAWRALSKDSMTRLVAACLDRLRVIIPQQGTTRDINATTNDMVTIISKREKAALELKGDFFGKMMDWQNRTVFEHA